MTLQEWVDVTEQCLAQGVMYEVEARNLPGGPVVKNPPSNAGDKGSIPGSGRFPGEGNGNSLQYS